MRKALAVLCFALLAAGTAGAQPYNMSITGASPGGLWSLLGVGLDKAVKEQFPGSTITYQTSGGGLANINLLDLGKAELAMALHKHIDKLQGVHGSMKGLTPQLMVSMDVVPYHPGAVRYYRQAGLVK